MCPFCLLYLTLLLFFSFFSICISFSHRRILHSFRTQTQSNNHNNFLSTSQIHGVYERHNEWENIVIPQMHQYNQQIHPYQHMTNNHNSRHKMSYLIKSLAPSSNYEARVQARNDHGWNKLSSTFHFSTRAEGKILLLHSHKHTPNLHLSPLPHYHHRHAHINNTHPVFYWCRELFAFILFIIIQHFHIYFDSAPFTMCV